MPLRWKAILLTLVGVPAMSALTVGAPLAWWDSRQSFGLQAFDTPMFLLVGGLSALGVGISARAYWRVVIKRQGDSDFPLVNRLVPLLIVLGVALGLFGTWRIHNYRHALHTYFAQRYCAEVLCPVAEGEILMKEDCAAEHPGFASCFDAAWVCQRELAAVPFETRAKAELQCIRAAIKP